MSNPFICRICLKMVNDEEEYSYLNDCYVNDLNKRSSLSELLQECVSEVNLQLTDSPIICNECLVLLKITNHFKKVCHETENHMYNYMKCNDSLEEYSNINLREVVNSTKVNNMNEFNYTGSLEQICNTCLKVSLGSNFVYVDNMIDINGNAVSVTVLAEYVPSFCLQSANSLFFCNECYEMLKKTYIFKEMCCETEELIYNFMKVNDLHLDKLSSIQLIDVLNFKSRPQIAEDKSSILDESSQYSIVVNEVVDNYSTVLSSPNLPKLRRKVSKIATNKILSSSKQESESDLHAVSIPQISEDKSRTVDESTQDSIVVNEVVENSSTVLSSPYSRKLKRKTSKRATNKILSLSNQESESDLHNVSMPQNSEDKCSTVDESTQDSIVVNEVVDNYGTVLSSPNSPKLRREASKRATNKILSLSKQESESDLLTVTTDVVKLKSESVKSDLKKSQSGGRHFKCKKCQYKSFKLELLIRHKLTCKNRLKSTQEIYNKKCKYCPKKFNRNSHLKRHEFIHTASSNHTCEKCGQAFAEKYQLTSHELKHTMSEGPYSCYHCPSKFFRKCDLDSHIKRTVLKQMKFHCKFCNKEFYDNRDMKSHMSKCHTAEKLPFECNTCSFSTTYSKRYHKHKQTCI